MSRIPEMEECLKEYWEEYISIKREFLLGHYKELEPEFHEKLICLAEDQIHKQREKRQGKIQAIYLNYLRSSIYTESYELLIGMGNSMLYLDENRSQTYWFSKLVYENVEKEMKEAESRIRQQFIRVEEYELFRLKQKLLIDYWCILEELFLLLIKESANLILDSALELEEELQILSGYYMDRTETLWSIKTERKITG